MYGSTYSWSSTGVSFVPIILCHYNYIYNIIQTHTVFDLLSFWVGGFQPLYISYIWLYHLRLAQSAEHRTVNPGVGGSIPPAENILLYLIQPNVCIGSSIILLPIVPNLRHSKDLHPIDYVDKLLHTNPKNIVYSHNHIIAIY